SQPRPASRKRLVGGRRLDPGRHRRNPHRHAAWIAEGSAALARLYQHHRECHEHGAARMPEREAMALGLDGDALDRGRHAGSGQRLPTTEGSQAASNDAGRSGSSPQQRLTRRPCSPSHRRLTSISAPTASQCSTKRRDIPGRTPASAGMNSPPEAASKIVTLTMSPSPKRISVGRLRSGNSPTSRGTALRKTSATLGVTRTNAYGRFLGSCCPAHTSQLWGPLTGITAQPPSATNRKLNRMPRPRTILPYPREA